MSLKRYTFRKSERLSSKIILDDLFEKGDSFMAFPFRVVYTFDQPLRNTDLSVFISVPKRRFKLAVHRNHIRRLSREVWRLHKDELKDFLAVHNRKLTVGLMFVGDDMPSSKKVEKGILKALQLLVKKGC